MTSEVEIPSTFGLIGKLFQEAAAIRNPRVTNRRINDLLTKTHTVGKITLPIPNLIAAQQMRQIEQLRQTDPLAWLMECLFILHNQTSSDALFLRGSEREHAIAAHSQKISAFDASPYMVALLELHTAIEKKNMLSVESMENQVKILQNEISRLASSPLPKQPDTPSSTSHAI